MFTTAIAYANESADIETIRSMSELTNEYGFMIVFSVITLILIVIFFINYQKRVSKRQDQELEIIKEESASKISHSDQMYTFMTEVQTKQISQLEQMTASLREIGVTCRDNQDKIEKATDNFEKIRESMIENGDKEDSILKALAEVLDYIKTNQQSAEDILDKVTVIEEYLTKNKDYPK